MGTLESAIQEERLAPAWALAGFGAPAQPLEHGWEFAEVPAGYCHHPDRSLRDGWRVAPVPGTVAGALRALGRPAGEAARDDRGYLYRVRFPSTGPLPQASLSFLGLATEAEAWLNGVRILESRNMFRPAHVQVGPLLRQENELLLHFRALDESLRHLPRRGERWTTPLVRDRNLRRVRTALLGRIPGWSDRHPPIGPWREVMLEEGPRIVPVRLRFHAALEGEEGVVRMELLARLPAGDPLPDIALEVGGYRASASARAADEGFEARLELRIPAAEPWWPHTHGEPCLYDASITAGTGASARRLESFRIGFRRIEERGDAGFGLRVNGREVFCRGANWTPADPEALSNDLRTLRETLARVREAGFNMLRVNGAVTSESDAFYEACDELGILVWQDFMFARLDYPLGEPAFRAEAMAEAQTLLARLHPHACLAVICGNTEVEQQALMAGLDVPSARVPFFREDLRRACEAWCPGLPYLPSSPTGGALAFHPDGGVAHYFGVGAYRRALSDARESGVSFASECLAFAQVPEDASLERLLGPPPRDLRAHDWRNGIPRDPGASWDFLDVTDHYLRELFAVDPGELRAADPGRYLELARVVPGEMMSRTLGIWQAADSACRGALVWWLRDLRPGAGWGLLDSDGQPKAGYWLLKRACAPRAVWFTDEGLRGLHLHARNDRPEPLGARLAIRLVLASGAVIESRERFVTLAPGQVSGTSVDEWLGRFLDTTWAYRFGPPSYCIAEAELADREGIVLSRAHYLPAGPTAAQADDLGLEANLGEWSPAAGGELELRSRDLALFVAISGSGVRPEDNYFHVPPGGRRVVRLVVEPGAAPKAIQVRPINSRRAVTAAVEVR